MEKNDKEKVYNFMVESKIVCTKTNQRIEVYRKGEIGKNNNISHFEHTFPVRNEIHQAFVSID